MFWLLVQGRLHTDAETDRLATELARAVAEMHRWTRRVVSWWDDDGFDLLLTPTLAEPPPVLGDVGRQDDGGYNAAGRSVPFAAYCAAFNVTVTALDSTNATVTGYTGTVHFTSSSAGSLPTDYTFTAGDNGAHTFSVRAKDAAGVTYGLRYRLRLVREDRWLVAAVNTTRKGG